MPGNDPRWLPKPSLGSKQFLSIPKHPHYLSEKFSQNRFWSLEKLFLLIYAWGCLKKQHFRGLQLEFFSLNHESPERVRWVWNSLRSCLKGLWSTFSIYFVVFEKKVFNFFFDSNMRKSLINCLTFELKNVDLVIYESKKKLKTFFSKTTK